MIQLDTQSQTKKMRLWLPVLLGTLQLLTTLQPCL